MRRHETSDELGVTRRDFLKNAGAGLVAAELAGTSPGSTKAAPAAAPVHFTPPGGLTQISSNLYYSAIPAMFTCSKKAIAPC